MLTWKDIENSNEDWWVEEEDTNFKALMEYAIKLSEKKFTPEEALQSLIRAGIFDENGNYTEPYKALEEFTAPK